MKYFHMTTTKYRMANKISRLKVAEVITKEDKVLRGEATKYFSELLKKDIHLDRDKHKDFLDCIPNILNEDQNRALTTIPSKEEILKAKFSF